MKPLIILIALSSSLFAELRIVSREISKEPSAFHTAIYAEPQGLRLISGAQASDDNGKTWVANPLTPNFIQDLPANYRRVPVTSVLDPRVGCVMHLFIGLDLPDVDPKISEPPIAQQHYYLRYRVSKDGGRSWLFDERIIQQGDYDAQHPIKDVWIGQNALFLGDRGCIPIITRDGKILVPAQITLRGENGKLSDPGGGHTYTDVVVLIGTWTADHHLQWQVSQRVQADPKLSTRGVVEPTLIQLDDDRLLMVMRGSNWTGNNGDLIPNPGPNVPRGSKWFAISSDGGLTWTKPEAWAYDDDQVFYSPSSMSTLFRHSTGRIFWAGNILPANPQGNLPRHPLVIGEVDRKTLRLIRSSVITLDQEEPADKKRGRFDLSHFHLLEDRASQEIVITYPRNHNRYKSREHVLLRLALP
ncbi:MAG: sialidase family protein [Prosthecobacter sp.]